MSTMAWLATQSHVHVCQAAHLYRQTCLAALVAPQVEELREQHGLSRPSNGYQSEPAASAQQRPQEPTASAQQRPQKEPAASAQQQPQKEPAASALSGRPISAGAPALLQPAHAGVCGGGLAP